MVDYKYGDLYNKPHIDKQMKIIACDFVGYGTPESKYPAKLECEGKVYLDAETNFYYKCRKLGFSYTWEKVEHEYELIVFKNSDIDQENFELSESLCSESELRFGCCESSVLKFRIHNTFISLKDKWLLVTETLEENTDTPFHFGRYKVFSDIPTADRLYRDVTAYDAMYDIINSSAINWYNTILPNKDSKVTMRQFRTSFANYFGLEQEEITLANDDMIVEKTIQVGEGAEIENETEHTSIIKESSLSGKDVITSICEINGCFGGIGRDGKFRYVYLNQDIAGLYPSNTLFPDHAPEHLPQSGTGHLYPQSPKGTRIGRGSYISADYEDYVCRKINKLQIREKENDIGGQYPKEKKENQNAYIIEDNFLVYGKSADELYAICKNIFGKIADIVYRPFSAECVGNPCLEVGDPVRLSTRHELIESYVLKRTLKGIQSLKDDYSADGEEWRTEKANSVKSSIIQLKGKTNTLIRNVDETISEIYAYDENGERYSRIEQNSEKINMKVSVGEVSSEISMEEGKVSIKGNRLEVESDNFKLDKDGNVSVSGAISARNGISFEYSDEAKPPNWTPYVFAETGYDNPTSGGMVGEPFLNIYSPKGTPCIVVGTGLYSEEKFKVMDTPYFPNGAMIKDAYIDTLHTTYRNRENVMEAGQGNNAINYINYAVRKSGAFVTVYGSYNVYIHVEGGMRYFVIDDEGLEFLPKYYPVRTMGYSYGRLFMFQLKTDGELRVMNLGRDIEISESRNIGFRFDYFLFQ